jgi:hypothetical protein
MAIIGAAAGEKHPDTSHLLRQLTKNGAKTIRWR